MIDIAEKAKIYRFSLLSSRLSQVLFEVLEQKTVITSDSEEDRIIQEGRDLLKQFISGARLVKGEHAKAGFEPSLENLKAYNRVMPTLEQMKQPSNEAISFFEKIDSVLENMQNKTQLLEEEKEQLKETRRFFTLFADFMYQKIIGFNTYQPNIYSRMNSLRKINAVNYA